MATAGAVLMVGGGFGLKVVLDWHHEQEAILHFQRRQWTIRQENLAPRWLRQTVPSGLTKFLDRVVIVQATPWRGANGSDVELLSRFQQLHALDLGKQALQDGDLVHLRELTRLRELKLDFNVAITDAGLRNLAGLRDLEFLDLSSTSVRGRRLDQLTRLRRLRLLRCPEPSWEYPASAMRLRAVLPDLSIELQPQYRYAGPLF